jgi:hypothetical protein
VLEGDFEGNFSFSPSIRWPLSSTAPVSGEVGRGARLPGGRDLYSHSPRFPCFYVPVTLFPSRVSLLFQISSDVGGFGGLGGRLVVLLILAIGLELLGPPWVGFCVGSATSLLVPA